MSYKKPKDVRYTDMAIWIDKNIYEPECDKELAYKYLWLLVNMLAHKAKYFYNNTDYEDFSYYLASIMLLRYEDKRQFEYDENGEPKLRKIRHVINYLKNVVYPYKVQYQQKFYKQNAKEEVVEITPYSLGIRMILQDVNQFNAADVRLYLDRIYKVFYNIIEDGKYSSDPYVKHNLFISSLLTFLSDLNPDKQEKKKLKKSMYMKTINNMRYKNSDIILYHITNEYSDIVRYVVNKGKVEIYTSIKELLCDPIYPNEVLYAAMAQPLFGEKRNED